MNIQDPNAKFLDDALALSLAGKADECERMLRSAPNQDDLRIIFNLGWHVIRKGDLIKGAKQLDSGRFINCFGSERIPGEIWRDQPLEGKTVLFRGEGGMGDEIINFRFAQFFKDRGAQVVVSCHPSLQSLFSAQGYATVAHQGIPFVHYDYWVPGMSAVHMCGVSYETLSGKPYLKAERTKLFAKKGPLKVGVRWAGNPRFEHEQHRRFDPMPLLEMYDIPGVAFHSLQRDDGAIDDLPFADLRNLLTDWKATASVISGLDLVITSCTSVAHCAAALGVETWVIVPILPYYTWALPGNTSPWYDSVRLFRQEEYGDWSAPMQNIRAALEARVQLKDAA